MTDDLIRLQVRVQQLETALRDIITVIEDPSRDDGDTVFVITALAHASLPTPPSPPTEAHAMRELQVADDDTA